MNQHTLRVLEFPKVLEALADCCTTPLGKEFARNLQPATEKKDIEIYLNQVEEVIKAGVSGECYQPFEAGSLRERVQLPGAYLRPDDFNKLREFFNCIMTIKKKLGRKILVKLVEKFGDYAASVKEIDRVFHEDGSLRDDASPRLSHIKHLLDGLRQKVIRSLQLTIEEHESLVSDKTVTMRSGRYVLPLKTAHRSSISGVVHDLSSSGQTVFVEPLASIDDQNRLSELGIENQEEIVRILTVLTGGIRTRIDDIEEDIIRIGELDLIFGKVTFANRINGKRAIATNDGCLKLRQARHPVLLMLKKDKNKVVPLDLELDGDSRVIVISGPNAGGKTVALKTIGLMVLMNQAGLLIPAEEGSALPIFRQIFADIGDEQSLEDNQSTFSAHLSIINQARLGSDRESIILLDEFLSQTSPDEGAALACALLEEFRDKGCQLFATTHNERIKMFAQTQPAMKNAGMEFKGRPTYRLILDIPQASNALQIAREFGLAEQLLKRAKEFLDPDVYSFNQLLEKLAVESNRLKTLREELEILKADYQDKVEGFRDYTRREKEKMHKKFTDFFEEKQREISTVIKEIKASRAQKSVVKKAQELMDNSLKQSMIKKEPYYPDIGEIVYSERYKIEGAVLAEKQGKYLVASEKMKVWLGPEEIAKTKSQIKKSNEIVKQGDFTPRLNLRGKYREDIMPLLERFIYEAIYHNLKQVVIVHGKGLGILRQAVTEYLKNNDQVASFRLGQPDEGGNGVTIVELK